LLTHHHHQQQQHGAQVIRVLWVAQTVHSAAAALEQVAHDPALLLLLRHHYHQQQQRDAQVTWVLWVAQLRS
jgi:hypothetical protein